MVASNSIIACIDTFPLNLNAQDNLVCYQWVALNGRVQVYVICFFFSQEKLLVKVKKEKTEGQRREEHVDQGRTSGIPLIEHPVDTRRMRMLTFDAQITLDPTLIKLHP